MRAGERAEDVARVMGLNVRSVYRWMAAFLEGGQKALLAKPIPGRPRKLDAEQLKWLARALRTRNPQQFQFPFALWTRALVQQLIAERFEVRMSLSAVGRLLTALGFTVQRPVHRAWQQDPVLVERWLAEEYPSIRAEAKREGAQIFFGDESGMRSDYHAGTTWAKRGRTPVVKATGARFGWNMLSAIGARGELRFMTHEGTVTAAVFCEFLRRLLVGADRPVYVIVDGHPAHRAKRVRQFVEAQEGRLKLFFLPPYSPELNPDELVWGHVKTQVARRLPQTKAELRERLLAALRHLQSMPAKVSGFFRHPSCAYAAA
jgi:transposase